MQISAILWDYDGTLVDTYQRNLAVTREIVSEISSKVKEDKGNMPAGLLSLDAYKEANHLSLNWQDLYANYFDLTAEETQEAGPLWSIYQEKCHVEASLIENIPNVIRELQFLPHGICSLNCSSNIKKYLNKNNLDSCFKSIIGYNDVPLSQQKPNPASFLQCCNAMQIDLNTRQTIIYIGDHEQDIQFAMNAEKELKKQGGDISVLTIAALYNHPSPSERSLKSDYTAYAVSDILDIIRQLT